MAQLQSSSITGSLIISSSGTDSTTNSLLVTNGAGYEYLKVTDGGTVDVRQNLIVNHATNANRSLRFSWGSIFATDTNNELILGSVYTDNTATRIYISGKNSDNSPSDAISMQAGNGVAIFSGTNNNLFDPQALLHVSGGGIFTGNVGIGTTSPTTKLTISQSADSNGIEVIGFDDRSTDNIKMHINSSGTGEFLSSNGLRFNSVSGQVSFLYNSNLMMQIASTSVNIRDDIELAFGNDKDYSIGYNTADDTFRIVDGSNLSSNPRLTINSTGNVGIGTSSPNYKLDVFGSGNFTDGLTVTGSALIQGVGNNADTNLQIVNASGDNVLKAINGRSITVGISNNNSINVGNGAHVISSSTSKGLNFYSNTQNGFNFELLGLGSVVRIDNNTGTRGFMGLGTTAPQHRLDVSGSGNFTDGLTVTGSISASGDLTIEGNILVNDTISTPNNVSLRLYPSGSSGQIFFGSPNDGTVLYHYSRANNGENTYFTFDAGYYVITTNDQNGIKFNNDVLVAGDLTVEGTVTAQEFHTEFVSASIIYQSGSTKFGDTSDDVHQFTGSLHIQTSGSAGANRLKLTTAAGIDVASIYNGNSNTTPVGTLVLNYGNTGAAILSGQSNGLSIRGGWTTNGTIRFNSYLTEIMRVTGTGLGIGTTTPRAKLDIQDSTHGTLMLSRPSETGYAMISGSSGLGFEFKTYDAGEVMAMKIANDGKVGIGTTSPTQKFEIDDGNLLVYPTGSSSSFSGLLLGFGKNLPTKAGLFGASDGRVLNSDGNLYISSRNVNAGNGSYILLGQRDSTTSSEKGTIILQTGTYNVNGQTGDMFFRYGNGDKVTLKGSTGNVGIGTTSPVGKLEVSDNIYIRDVNGSPFIALTEQSSGQVGTPFYIQHSSTQGTIYSTQPLRIFGGTVRAIDIDSSGRVGIGTSAPTSTLHIAGTARIHSAANGAFGTLTLGSINDIVGDVSYIDFKNNGSSWMRISNGNVGIGTTAPTKTLDVRGSTVISGSFSGADANALVLDNTDSSGNPSIMRMIFSGEGGNEALQIGMYSSPTVKPVYFQSTQGSSWGNIVFQRYGGSVGIRTLEPSANLTVQGNGTTTGKTFLAQDSNASALFTILDNGNVGIGTTSPSAKLHLYDSNSTSGGSYASPYYVQLIRSSTGGSPSATYFTKEDYSLSGTDQFGNSLGKQLYATISNTGNSIYRNLISRVHTVSSGTANTIALYGTHFEGLGTGTIANFYSMVIGGKGGVSGFSNVNSTITNTYGLYLANLTSGTQTNDPYAIYQEGTEKIYLQGNVGIGTTSPAYKLHVNGTARFEDAITLSDDVNNRIDADTTGLLFKSAAHYTFSKGANTLMFIKETGNVGIGTTSPLYKLDVSDSNKTIAVFRTTNANADLYLRASGTASDGKVGFRASANNLILISNGAVQASFNGNNFGIGTTSPVYPLHINNGTGDQSALFESTDVTNTIGIKDSNSTSINTTGIGVVGDDLFLYAGSTAYNQRLRIQGSTGNVGIGTTSPDASAILDIASTSKGVVFPRMTSAQRTAISSPTTGLIVYQTDATEGLYIYKSTGWVQII